MKITLKQISDKCSCDQALLLYNKLELYNIDLDNKTIEVYCFNNVINLKWLCKKFNLTMNIIYNRLIIKYINGLQIYYKNDNYEYWIEYNDKKLKSYTKDSDGKEIWYKYNDKGLLTRSYNSKSNYWRKYNDDGILIDTSDAIFDDSELKYDIKLKKEIIIMECKECTCKTKNDNLNKYVVAYSDFSCDIELIIIEASNKIDAIIDGCKLIFQSCQIGDEDVYEWLEGMRDMSSEDIKQEFDDCDSDVNIIKVE